MTGTDIFAIRNPFRITVTAEQRLDIEGHWAKVRAGLNTPADHVFDQDIAGQITVRNERISRHFDAAAREMREIDRLRAMEES